MTANPRREAAPLDVVAAADRLERWADIWAREKPITAADVLALVAGFRAAVERAESIEDDLVSQSDRRAYWHERAVAAERRLAELQQALEAIPATGTPSEAMCECGHPARLHWMASAQPSCRATVYTDAPLGGSAFPCHCRSFARPEGTPNTTSNHVGGGA